MSRGSGISRRITDGVLEHQGTKESSEKALDAGAWLQYQQKGMLQRNKRDLAGSGHLQGELTPMECPHPTLPHQLCSPPPSAAGRGSLPLSITLGAGGGWQREAAQLQPPGSHLFVSQVIYF